MEEIPGKIFHNCNHRNRDGTRKSIQLYEIYIPGEANQLYWKKPSRITPRKKDPIKTRSYVKKEPAFIGFISDRNQLGYKLISTQN